MRRDLLPQQRWLNEQPRTVRLFVLLVIFAWQPAALFAVWQLSYASASVAHDMPAAAKLIAVGFACWGYIMLRYTGGVCMLAAKRARVNKRAAKTLRIIGGTIFIALLAACLFWLFILMTSS